MNYQEALAYIYSFSDFERGSSFTRDRNENQLRETALLELLGNPHQHYTSTLIAGTKGKGSTATFIERVLRQAGVRTGLYTQPDLHTFRERTRVSGRLISEEEMAALVPEIRVCVEQVQARQEFGPFITYEVATALTFLYFDRQHVDHAVVEVGIGGRLDATNILNQLVSVITSISYDHMQILGNTLTQIATEKAGIIKPNGLLVTSAQAPEALRAIASIVQQRQAHMVRIGAYESDPVQADVETGGLPALMYRYRLEERSEERQRFTIWAPDRLYTGLEIPLAGLHQLENATAALATLDLLREHGLLWDESALREGFRTARWSARMEVVGHQPTIVIDGAHNADSIQKLLQALRATFEMRQLIFVFSPNQDKDLVGMVRALANIDIVVLTRMKNLRATPIEQLEKLFAEHAPHVIVHTAKESGQAMDMAHELAEKDDLICATGSLYLAAEALRWSAAHGNKDVAKMIEGFDHS
ncbi:MAG: folylpolyglutamate synthase/dihydrofolate synthase family protein [Ktedonobacteraceae bacterium]